MFDLISDNSKAMKLDYLNRKQTYSELKATNYSQVELFQAAA